MSTTLRVTRHATKYTCVACRTHTSSFSTRASSQAVLDTEKWRKKIWGTDKPPGAKDPYGGPSAAEIYAAERQGKKIGKPKAPKAKAVKLEQFDMSTYQESDSWEGLEEVGGKGIWWMNREEPEFKGFMPWMKVEDPYEVTAALHRAVVEVFALRAANEPLELLNAASIGPDVTSEVQIVSGPEGARLALPEHMELSDITASFSQVFDETAVKTNPSMAEAEVAADRSAVKPQSENNVVEMVDETEVKVAPSLAEEEVAADRSSVDPMRDAAYRAMVESWDPAWLNISLKDPALKFAVIKRCMQLTGFRLSDADINNSSAVVDILGHLATPPKARKLVEALAQKGSLFELPNVRVSGRRVTPIDKEKELGRWKVIEEELKNRGLPVTGHDQ